MATGVLRSELGPLTTVFTPPADCRSFQFLEDTVVGRNIAGSFYCYPSSFTGIGRYNTSVIKSCFPEGYASFLNMDWTNPTTYFASYIGFYSPASICPSDYSVACVVARSKGQSDPFVGPVVGVDRNWGDQNIWQLLREGETASGCCPTGYVCDQTYATRCTSNPSPRPIEVTDAVKCHGTLTPVADPTEATYAVAKRVIMVQAATSEHTSTRTTTSAPTSSAPTSSAPTSSVPSETSLSKPSQGLPLSAKIAIGVVIPLIAILSGAACFFIYKYRRKRKLLQAGQGLGQDARGNGSDDLETPKPELPGDEGMVSSGPNGTAFRKPEMDATVSGSGGMAAELAAGGISELHGITRPGELDSMSKSLNAVDVVGQEVNNKHVDESTNGLWQWSSYWD
ncbi:hypothetical protein GGI35DRAFT_475774 [Trichoderma velutinum]